MDIQGGGGEGEGGIVKVTSQSNLLHCTRFWWGPVFLRCPNRLTCWGFCLFLQDPYGWLVNLINRVRFCYVSLNCVLTQFTYSLCENV